MSKKYHLFLKGFVGGYDFDADYVEYILGKNENNEVHVLIDSLGGAVNTALSIAASFARHGNVHVHFVGMNASAATIASLGAKKITMDENAMYLVHKVSQEVFKWSSMNADSIQTFIDALKQKKEDLEKIDYNIASMYAKRCQKEASQLLDLMQKGGWLNAQEALAWGFIDEITQSETANPPALTKNLVTAMVDAGIPIPDIPLADERSIFDRIRHFINKFSNPNPNSTMSKVFKFICQLLALENIVVTDGIISISEEQAQTIEDALAANSNELAERDNRIEDLENQISVLTAQIEELKDKPAEKSDTVTDDGRTPKNETVHDTFINAVSDAKEMFKQIP